MVELLSAPAVLELALAGADDEKAFLMGVLLMDVAEHRMAQGAAPNGHLLVIEEAHRLLRNTSLDGRDDEANARGAMLESFINLLAEMRAFRQGICIIEQSPRQLHPAVPANLNLTISLRLATNGDVEEVGRNLQMDAAQRRLLAELPVGTAIVGGARIVGARRVRLPHLPFGQPDGRSIEAAQARVAGSQAHSSLPAHLEAAVSAIAVGSLLAVAAGDAPHEIVVRAVTALRTLPQENACRAMIAAGEELLREKGLEGALSLQREDRLRDLWEQFSRGATTGNLSGSSLVAVIARLSEETRHWGMPPARRNPAACHNQCPAWFDARWAVARTNRLLRPDQLPREARRCFESALAAAVPPSQRGPAPQA
jgi:hypothetical protein